MKQTPFFLVTLFSITTSSLQAGQGASRPLSPEDSPTSIVQSPRTPRPITSPYDLLPAYAITTVITTEHISSETISEQGLVRQHAAEQRNQPNIPKKALRESKKHATQTERRTKEKEKRERKLANEYAFLTKKLQADQAEDKELQDYVLYQPKLYPAVYKETPSVSSESSDGSFEEKLYASSDNNKNSSPLLAPQLKVLLSETEQEELPHEDIKRPRSESTVVEE